MLFITDILFDERIKTKKRDKIFSLLRNQKPVSGVFFLIRVAGSPNILEVVTTHELYRLDGLNRQTAIVGVVKDKDKAYEVIEQWIGDLYTRYDRILSSDLDKEFDIQWQ